MDLKEIKGLGAKRIETLNEKGIFSCEDLALYLPKSYFDLNSKDTFSEDGRYKLILCQVLSDAKVVRIRKNFGYTFVECLDQANRPFKAIWYNQPYIKSAVKNGDWLYLYGKNSTTKHGYFIVSTFKNKDKIDKNANFYPIYRSMKNLGQSVLVATIKQALEVASLESIIPHEFVRSLNLMGYKEAVSLIHNPSNLEDVNRAKQRVDIEKALPIIKISNDLKNQKFAIKRQNIPVFSSVYEQFCVFLPYRLTPSQLEVLKNIEDDLNKPLRMNRLIEGDVGSGKTILALITAAAIIESGKSVILIAPTEILARQHFALASSYFDKLGLFSSLLTSSTKPLQKRQILSALASQPMLLVGTHSCLSPDIDMQNVGLVIIDEQHRFGVKQRSALLNRASSCDLLMLSATPIPRSLSLVYYGGLDISILEKPPFEKQIQTNIVNLAKEEDMWNFIGQKMDSGSKVYVVCANIDDMDDDCYQGLSAKSMHEFLQRRFPKHSVFLAHGKLDSQSEEKTLCQFSQTDSSMLVATTIVEVGIDVKEADIMVLVSPEKFGLATLHQLRGRIGRAGQQSYCFCLSRNLQEKSLERIKFFKEHSNGFEIAEFDYAFRGAGEILSTKQHGKIENPFDLVSLSTLKMASQIYEELAKKYSNTDFLLANLKKEKDLIDIGLN